MWFDGLLSDPPQCSSMDHSVIHFVMTRSTLTVRSIRPVSLILTSTKYPSIKSSNYNNIGGNTKRAYIIILIVFK